MLVELPHKSEKGAETSRLSRQLYHLHLHCENFCFTVASRQKIPILRTENPAVDTRTICLPPTEFFKITRARKATAGKSRPETTDTAGKSRPSGH